MNSLCFWPKQNRQIQKKRSSKTWGTIHYLSLDPNSVAKVVKYRRNVVSFGLNSLLWSRSNTTRTVGPVCFWPKQDRQTQEERSLKTWGTLCFGELSVLGPKLLCGVHQTLQEHAVVLSWLPCSPRHSYCWLPLCRTQRLSHKFFYGGELVPVKCMHFWIKTCKFSSCILYWFSCTHRHS